MRGFPKFLCLVVCLVTSPVFAGDPPEGSSGGYQTNCVEVCTYPQGTGYEYEYCTGTASDCSCCAIVYECCLFGVCSTQPYGMSARDWLRACYDGNYQVNSRVECFPTTSQVICSSEPDPRQPP